MNKNILVTTALPYANGSIHLGHLLEGIQADIWVRFQKAIGNTCYFFCADDTHGTPIMLAARNQGIKPEELIARVYEEHYRDLTGFLIEYDNYYSTNSEENRYFSERIYNSLKEKGHINSRDIEQSYCEHDAMFLPDRFIKGTCPKCGAQGQYGDGCEVCSGTYSPKDLKDAACSICGNTPSLKSSKHIFFKLQDFSEYLDSWVKSGDRLQEPVQKKLQEWFSSGLQEWDISRDGPYFGFKIPGEENKYFYVWLDAPIGYMASSKNYFSNNEDKFNQFWLEKKGEVIHFIGKDILYFHTLFWPAMLHGADFCTPTKVHVHGFMTVNGEKMSKSRGTFIKASTYLKHLNPEHFRFYLAGKLNDTIEDMDLNLDDFAARVNSDLVGNLVNIVSRVGTSILDKLSRKLGKLTEEYRVKLNEILEFETSIREAYESKNFHKALKDITKAGDIVNKTINDTAPWLLIKEDEEKTREVVTFALNAARILAIYFSPILPDISKKIFKLLNVSEASNFLNLQDFIENTPVEKYEFLAKRVEKKDIEKMVEESKEKEEPKKTSVSQESPVVNEEGYISIEELMKVELRVGEIVEAGSVEGADKLVNVKVNLGEKGVKNVFAGIKAAYSPEDLKGLKVVVVANLKPRKMKFGVSEAMLLASGKDSGLSLFIPHRNASPGDLLK